MFNSPEMLLVAGLVGAFIFSTGLAVGWFMGVSTRGLTPAAQ
jgi:hypothetical protein